MSILKVARMGHPVLRAKARPLEKAEIRTAAMQKLIDDMIDTMSEYHGVGLAAPQIHEGLRIFVAALDAGDDDEDEADPIALINPEITVVGSDVVEDWEGCLSIPDIRGRVPRAREIKVRAFDRTGARIELSAHDRDLRVDDGDDLTVVLAIVARLERRDEDPDPFVHLRRGKADAVVLGHRVDHVVDQLLDDAAPYLGLLQRPSLRAQHRVPHARDFQNGHAKIVV